MQDRGAIKWTSLMLPEHVQALKQLYDQQNHKPKPILDEQKIEEIEFALQFACKDDLSISVTYYKDYDFKTVQGKPGIRGEIINVGGLSIKFGDILDVEIL